MSVSLECGRTLLICLCLSCCLTIVLSLSPVQAFSPRTVHCVYGPQWNHRQTSLIYYVERLRSLGGHRPHRQASIFEHMIIRLTYRKWLYPELQASQKLVDMLTSKWLFSPVYCPSNVIALIKSDSVREIPPQPSILHLDHGRILGSYHYGPIPRVVLFARPYSVAMIFSSTFLLFRAIDLSEYLQRSGPPFPIT